MLDDLLECLDADAELIVGSACGDGFVSVGVNVGVDPDGDVCLFVHFACDLVNHIEFRNRLDIEAADVV